MSNSVTNDPSMEQTLVLIKPDGVERGLVGEIIKRIEQRGLKIVAMQMVSATKEQVNEHYPKDEAWITRLGDKTAQTYAKYGYDLKTELGTEDKFEIGKMVRSWLLDFMTEAPIVKMVVRGNHAVDMIRKITGSTLPALADVGTIRGDFSCDSPALANKNKRSVRNMIHASETPEEAAHEIAFWFKVDEINEYKRFGEV